MKNVSMLSAEGLSLNDQITITYMPTFYMYQQKFQHSNKDKLPKRKP